MDDVRGSFSRLKKKLKNPLKGGTRKQEKTGSDSIEERVGQTSSLPKPEPHAVVGGDDDREGKGADAKVDQPLQRDKPDPVPTGENDGHPERGEKDAGGKEVDQEGLKPAHPPASATGPDST